MKIVVAGGSGFIGAAVCRAVADAGHTPLVLSRKPLDFPYKWSRWDGESLGEWQNELRDALAVVNLAGESVASGRWTAARKKALVESRVLSTRALVAAMSASRDRPKVLVNASAIGFYGDRGEEALGEDAVAGNDFLARLCVDWEEEARRAEDLGVRVALPRIGVVLGPGGGALAKMLPAFRWGLGGPLGGGKQWMSWISLEDVSRLVLHMIEREVSGPVNATAPHPVRNRDFAKALGRALHRPAFLPAPALALRLALGEMAQALLLSSQRVLPEAAVRAGFVFRYPELESALGAALV